MAEVLARDEFTEWYRDLSDDVAEDVDFVVELLVARGVSLGFPYSSDIKGTSVPLRELRIQSGGKPLRVFYAFDPKRQAVLLIGGDKTGDDRFYDRMIPVAERIWRDYLADTA